MRKDMSLAALAAFLGLCAPSAVATAEEAGGNFNRDRNESVRSRSKPEFDAAGVRLGGFRLFPELSTSAEFNDNVFATEDDAESDVIYAVAPSLTLKSDWNTHALNFAAGAKSAWYADTEDQDYTDWRLSTDGRLDVTRSFNIFGDAFYGQLTEPLSSAPTNAALAEPVEYQKAAATLGLMKTFNRLRLSGRAGYQSLDYDDAQLRAGGVFDQDDRDSTRFTYEARGDYAISPATALFLSYGANTRDHDQDPPEVAVNRDSEGYEILTGVNFDLTNLISGEIGFGYLSQSYDQDGVDDQSGLAVRTRVTWFPDQLVTVNFGAERSAEDSGAAGSVGYIASDVDLGVDYEFRRNVVLGLAGGYSLAEYEDVDREDTTWRVSGSVDYALNRTLAVFLTATHQTQDSSGLAAGRAYDVNSGVVGLKLRR